MLPDQLQTIPLESQQLEDSLLFRAHMGSDLVAIEDASHDFQFRGEGGLHPSLVCCSLN